MRHKYLVLMVAMVFALGLVAVAHGQQDPSEETATRGSFLTSRPPVGGGVALSASTSSGSSSSAGGGSSSRPSTKPKSSGRSTGKGSGKGTGKGTSSKGTTTAVSAGATTNSGGAVKTYASGPIGLGYTLFMRNALGDAIRIDPAREFVAGDRIRLSMETNTDGYLYVFHTENDGPPTMIFPDARLNNGENDVEGHVPYEVPSPYETSENLRWFTFDQKPAIERLYIVVTREPLPGIPIGDNLVSFCRDNPRSCPLSMSPQAWANVKASMAARARVSKSSTYGQAQTSVERDSTTRGLGLDQSAPEPSVVRMNVSTNDSVLVTSIDLVHR